MEQERREKATDERHDCDCGRAVNERKRGGFSDEDREKGKRSLLAYKMVVTKGGVV
jgi:hypothetical protein